LSSSDDSLRNKGLAGLVSSEARISNLESKIQPKAELISEGWKRRFFTDGQRAKEMVKFYEEVGFEVHLEPVLATEFSDECEDCRLLALLNFVTIYTRNPKSKKYSDLD
jgi:hypothetical protein